MCIYELLDSTCISLLHIHNDAVQYEYLPLLTEPCHVKTSLRVLDQVRHKLAFKA